MRSPLHRLRRIVLRSPRQAARITPALPRRSPPATSMFSKLRNCLSLFGACISNTLCLRSGRASLHCCFRSAPVSARLRTHRSVLLWRSAQPVSAMLAAAHGLRMRSSAAIFSPVTIGSFVILPAGYRSWDSEKLRIVLAHERSHIRHGDFYLQALAGLYAAIVWFVPWDGGSSANSPIWLRPSATAPVLKKRPAAPPTLRSSSNSRPRRT